MEYVYGSVRSRRLGQPLGIDTIPLKTCNWDRHVNLNTQTETASFNIPALYSCSGYESYPASSSSDLW